MPWSAVLRAASSLLLGAVGAWSLLACSDDRGSATGNPDQPVPVAVIDTDATLTDVEPGQGVGLFVEYASGGRWRLYVTCDSLESDLPCHWDVIASSRSPIEAVVTEGEGGDGWDHPPERVPTGSGVSAIRFARQVSTTLEGVRFETTAGAPIRLDVLLDGVADGRYVYWVGGGGVHGGAPASVLDLLPTAP